MTTDLERVRRLVDWLVFERIAENKRNLADKLGYTESSLSQILNGKVSLSNKFIKKLANINSNINEDWLTTGEGEMLKPPKNDFSQLTEDEISEIVSDTYADHLMAMYKKGEIYPTKVVSKMMAEKDAKIEELQKRIWTLEQENASLRNGEYKS